MTAAPSRKHLKRRLDDYLWADSAQPLVKLREILRNQFMPLGETVIFGGLARDIARSGPNGFRSDVDLVINAPATRVRELAETLGATPNRFGGFSHDFLQWKIDFWSLQTTWAHREGHVRVRGFSDLIKCTFFTSDAVAYSLHSKALFASDDYLRDIWAKRLEINLLPNPSINGNLVRAVRRALSDNLAIGPKLRRFIIEHLNEESFNYIVDTELKLYNHSYAKAYSDWENLTTALLFRVSRLKEHHGQANQYWLAL